MIIICRDRVGCSAHQNKGTCDNRRSIRLAEIEERVVAALRSYLLAPDLVAEAVEAYRIERNRLAKERAKQRCNAERDLAAIDRKIAGVIAMGEKGGDPRALALRLNELEADRRALLAQMPGKGRQDCPAPQCRRAVPAESGRRSCSLDEGRRGPRARPSPWSGSSLNASEWSRPLRISRPSWNCLGT